VFLGPWSGSLCVFGVKRWVGISGQGGDVYCAMVAARRSRGCYLYVTPPTTEGVMNVTYRGNIDLGTSSFQRSNVFIDTFLRQV